MPAYEIRSKDCSNSNCDKKHYRPGHRCGRCSSYFRRYGIEHPGVDLLRGSEKCKPGCTCGLHKYYGGARKCKPGCTCKRHTAPGRPKKTYIPGDPSSRSARHRGYAQAKKIFKLPKHCQVRGCKEKATERHHLDGDATNSVVENLIGLCIPHHKEVHKGIVNTAYERR